MGSYASTPVPPTPAPPIPQPTRNVALCNLARSVGWGQCSGCILGLLDEKNLYPPPARKLLDEIYDYTSKGLNHHRDVTAATYIWCDEVVTYLGRFLEARGDNDRAAFRLLATQQLDDAPVKLQNVLTNIESGLRVINEAIGRLSAFRTEITNAFNSTGIRSTEERAAIEAKLDNAVACFEATQKALYCARSVIKRDAQHVTFLENNAITVKAFIQLEKTTRPMFVTKGKQLIELCKSYKKRHAEYVDYCVWTEG